MKSTNLWFKRKRYGWGWTPITWQGWLVMLGYVALVFLFARRLTDHSSLDEVAHNLLLPVAALTIVFFVIAYKKGEKPKWQWGDAQE